MWNLDIRQSFTRFRHLLRVAPLVVLVAAIGQACIPTLLFTLDDPNPQRDAIFGNSLAVGDVNGDGKADIAVGAAQEDVGRNAGQGRVYVFSGADGSVLLTLDSPNPQEDGWFGYSVAAGDVDGDRGDDIVVAARWEDVGGSQGQAYVFSGVSGSLLLTLTVPSPDPGNPPDFGPLAVGDVNGDGKGDIAVGARTQGRAYVFSGADGSLLFTLDTPNPQPDGWFGYSVAMGDVDGDGRDDIAVGAPLEDVGGNNEQGRAYVFSGADGSLLFTLDSPNPQASAAFGSSLAVGDVNGDGKADIAVGAPDEGVGGKYYQGRAYVFSGADGSLLFTLDTPNPQAGAWFGRSLATADVNGDGTEDIVVGAPAELALWFGYDTASWCFVFSGSSGSLLVLIPNPVPGGAFGSPLAAGDVNGDGLGEIAVPDHARRVYVYSPVPASVSAAAGSFAIPR